jgi:hypothetical protein
VTGFAIMQKTQRPPFTRIEATVEFISLNAHAQA